MPRSTLLSLPVIAAMLLMPLPRMSNKEPFPGVNLKQKLFGFLNLILMLAATTAPQIETIAPAAQGQVELPTREFDLREKLKDKKFTDGRKQPSNRFCRRRCAEQLRYYELRSIHRTIACKRIARSPGERYCRVCNGVVGNRNSG